MSYRAYAYLETAAHGIMGGYSDGTFRPGNDVTRGQISKTVSNAAGLTGTPTGQHYAAVAEGYPQVSAYVLYVHPSASGGSL